MELPHSTSFENKYCHPHRNFAVQFGIEARSYREQYHEIPDATLTIALLTHQRENVRMECLQTIAFLVRDASLDVIRVLIQSSSADEGIYDEVVHSTIWTSLPTVLNHDHEDVHEAGLCLIEGSLAHDIFRRAMVNDQSVQKDSSGIG
ncbi:hypothetical protein A0H81_10328 [Grifola frondosa]|uniref:Uncharacterized protein n=1 Tax=Grifola frondosa TaxID=5627 RepID=A0A1C7LYA6_GRIFR|nr:hypothetical protein A0H81_10328 [Grifola frondosa]